MCGKKRINVILETKLYEVTNSGLKCLQKIRGIDEINGSLLARVPSSTGL